MSRTRLFRILSGSLVLGLLPGLCVAAEGANALSFFIANRIIAQALLAFWGISGAFMSYYAFRMILEAQKEQAYTDARQSFTYAFFGFVTIALGVAFADAFITTQPSGGTITTISPDFIIPGLNSVSEFIISGSSGLFVLIVTVAGFRMVTSQGEQGEFDKWKKILIGNVGGVIVMILSSVIISAIANRDAATIGLQVAGLISFLLTIFGFACAVALIIAGVMLIVSVDESLKDRAKKIVFGTLITLAIVLALIAIIKTFALTGTA